MNRVAYVFRGPGNALKVVRYRENGQTHELGTLLGEKPAPDLRSFLALQYGEGYEPSGELPNERTPIGSGGHVLYLVKRSPEFREQLQARMSAANDGQPPEQQTESTPAATPEPRRPLVRL